MIYESTNARAPTVFIRVYQYRERLVLSSPLFIPLNSSVITDINKCILYKTMYKFPFKLHPRLLTTTRAHSSFTFMPKYKIIVDLLFFLFFFLSFFSLKTRSDTRSRSAQSTSCVSVLIVDTIGSSRRGTTSAIYI